jgi:hypothetical protein
MGGKNALVAVALTAALSILGAASAAAAGSERWPRGGYVLPCSLDGVNPVYHPHIFGDPGTAYAYGFVRSRNGVWQVRPDCRR